MEAFESYIPTKIIFGQGRLEVLKNIKLPGKCALIVTTQGGSVRRNGTLDRVMEYLGEQKITVKVFAGISANPEVEEISLGKKYAKEMECDFVIGIGGGSALDGAKAIAVLAKNEGNIWDYIQRGTGGSRKPLDALPVVAIPTTAGTGSEVNPWMVVSNTATEEKAGCGWDFTFPCIAVVDPELTLSVPKKYTAYQGMDVFFHAAEGYLSTCATPLSRMFSLQAIRLLAEYLPLVIENGQDIEARSKVAWASTLAGLVESLSDTISLHFISHAMTAIHQIPHGLALTAICNAYFSRFLDVVPKELGVLAEAMGAEISEMSEEEMALEFMQRLDMLIKRVGLSKINLEKYGLNRENAFAVAKKTVITDGHLYGNTPVKLEEKEIEDIIVESFCKIDKKN